MIFIRPSGSESLLAVPDDESLSHLSMDIDTMYTNLMRLVAASTPTPTPRLSHAAELR